MSGTLNKVILIGHLGDDVKIHYFDHENCIARFPLATNETYIYKKTNEKKITTEWHTIVVRNKTAENCEKYLSKGDLIYLEGKIKSREWQTPEGIAKMTVEIHASEVTFLHTKNNNLEIKKQSEPTKPQTPEHGLPF